MTIQTVGDEAVYITAGVEFSCSCTNPRCTRSSMRLAAGMARHQFTMRCHSCGERVMVYVGSNPKDQIVVPRRDCPKGVNFNDYLMQVPGWPAWKRADDQRRDEEAA